MIRFYIDEDASRKSFVGALRQRKFNVLSTPEVGNRGLSDLDQLIWATENNRTIYTFNVGDYCRLHKIYTETEKQHSGIIVVPRQKYSVGEQLRGLQKLSTLFNSEQIKNQLLFLGAYI